MSEFGPRIMTSERRVAVKHLPEKLSVKEGRRFFREVEPHLQADRPRVVLDCSRVRQFDRAGVRVLLCCLEEAMKRNGDVKLAAIPPGAAAILELTRAGRLFEAFDNTADAVHSFQQRPLRPVQHAPRPEYSTVASGADNCLDRGRSDVHNRLLGSEATMRITARWPMRQIAGCLLLLLVAPFATAATSIQQETSPSRQDISSAQAQSQDANAEARKAGTEPFQPEMLPNSPGALRSQTADNNSQLSSQQPSPNLPQNSTQEPAGTAAAGLIKATGVAASEPAGAAIAPAKQKRARSILIKVGVIAGASVAIGSVVALSKGSPSRPPGAR